MSDTKTKHTPGPWTALPRGGVLAADGLLVAQCVQPYARATTQDRDADREVAEGMNANARLIAAAPAMREALEAVLAAPHGCPMCDSGKLRPSAVARGEGHWPDCAYPKLRAALAKTDS